MPIKQPQAIRTVFFDAGFTLLHPYPSTAEICQQVCLELGLHVHLDSVKGRMHIAEDYFLRQMRLNRHTWASEHTIRAFWLGYYTNLLRPFIEEQDEARLIQLAQAITREFEKHTRWQLYTDVLPTLQALRAHGYTLGVISDWGIALSSILRHHHLTQYFDCLLMSATTQHAKPSPSLYQEALQRANAIADYTLHIGDSYVHDVLGARAVGILPVLLDRAGGLEESSVDCVLVHSLYELLDLLEVARP